MLSITLRNQTDCVTFAVLLPEEAWGCDSVTRERKKGEGGGESAAPGRRYDAICDVRLAGGGRGKESLLEWDGWDLSGE